MRRRTLVVLRGSIDRATLRARYAAVLVEGGDVAVCCVLPAGHDGLDDALRAQREVTSALRACIPQRAEDVAVLVVSEADELGVEECARAWGATEVVR